MAAPIVPSGAAATANGGALATPRSFVVVFAAACAAPAAAGPQKERTEGTAEALGAPDPGVPGSNESRNIEFEKIRLEMQKLSEMQRAE